MQADGHVLVIGAMGVDVKGKPHQPLGVGVDNPGRVQTSFGGVARNIAENLAHLEIDTVFLSAVGDDSNGDWLMAHLAAVGVDTTHVLQVAAASTGSFLAVLDHAGDLQVAISDYAIMDAITPTYLTEQAALFAAARMVVIDLNLSVEAVATVVQLCQTHAVPLCVDPTAPAQAHKIRPHLSSVYLIAPNATETHILCDKEVPHGDFEGAIHIAKDLVAMGVQIAILTLGEAGVVFASGNGGGHITARKTQVIDATGAGDALTAAVIFGLINDIPLEEALRLGIVAASLTLHSRESVYPDLTPDALYEHL